MHIALVGKHAALMGELQAWAAGLRDGGPNGDGRYPFTMPDGAVILVPSPLFLENLVMTPPVLIYRVVPVDAYEAYIVAPHGVLGAVAYHFVYGNGNQPVDQEPLDSIGAPFGKWRIRGVKILPSVNSDPETEYSQIVYSGIGSQQTAINVGTAGAELYVGHYHGGQKNAAQSGVIMTQPAMLANAELIETFEADWPTGEHADFTCTLRLNPDGSLTSINRVVMPHDALSAALDIPMLSTAFKAMSLDLGGSWIDISALSSNYPANVDEVWFRNGTTGLIAKFANDASASPSFDRKFVSVTTGRVKLHSRFNPADGAPLGDVTCTSTWSYAYSEPDVVIIIPPTFFSIPAVDEFDTARPDDATLPSGWDRTHPATGTHGLSEVIDGTWTVTGVNGQPNRSVTESAIPPGSYEVVMTYETPDGGLTSGSLYIDPDNTGSPDTTYAFANYSGVTGIGQLILPVTIPDGGMGYIRHASANTTGRRTRLHRMEIRVAEPVIPPPPPPPFTLPFTDTYISENPTEAGSPAGWTRASAPTPNSVVSGGIWTTTGITGSLQRWVFDEPLAPGDYHLEIDYSTGGAYAAGGVRIAASPSGSGTDAIVGTNSFNSPTVTTLAFNFTVAADQLGYVTMEASAAAGRSWSASEMRLSAL